MRSYDGPPTGLPGFRFAGHTPEHGRTKSMIAQQLAYMMLIQALRLYLADATTAGRGWLSALSDKHMSIAITSMHRDPGYPWTLHLLAERVGMSRSAFARPLVPRRWNTSRAGACFLAADRLKNSGDGLAPSRSRLATNPRAPSVRPSIALWATLQGSTPGCPSAVQNEVDSFRSLRTTNE